MRSPTQRTSELGVVRPKGSTRFGELPQHEKYQCRAKPDRLTNIVPYLPIVAAVLAGGFLIYNRRKTRTQIAKDTFGVFIMKKIGALPNHGVAEFYRATKPEVRDAVLTVWHYLKPNERSAIDRLWKEYDEIPQSDMESINENDWAEELEKMDGNTQFQPPKQIVKYYLSEFQKFSA